jgi:hypothetical protein
MADDTTVFVEDLASLKNILQLLTLFHIFAGLKLNKTKTEAVWIGKCKNYNDKPLGLKWVKEVHSLGIFFSYDTDYVVQKNFTDRIRIFKQILDLWSQRDLSIIGKITILKSLAFSTLTYQCCSLTPPENFLDNVSNLAFKFLWNGKSEKVKRKTIIADYSEGGLQMLDIRSFVSAQKAIWVKRLCKGEMSSWKAYPFFALQKLLGIHSFKCSLNLKNRPRINDFYWDIIKNWTSINDEDNKKITVMEIRRQYLWLNKHIIINKTEVKWNNWIKKNIMMIHDIVDSEGKFFSKEDINRLYNFNCDILQYNSVKDAIPKGWRETLKSIQVDRDEITIDEDPSIIINKQKISVKWITNREVYRKIVQKIQLPHVTKIKWETELKIHTDSWPLYLQIPLVIRDTKIRSFQYKLIMNLIPCNLYLYRIGKVNSYNCNFYTFHKKML